MEPEWIEGEAVLALHGKRIAESGGADGLRDAGMLDSALSRPKNLFYYSETPPPLSVLAAEYAFGIVKNHPFVDGNKRTALTVCALFFKVNGAELTADNDEMFAVLMRLAADELSAGDFAGWLDLHIAPLG